MKIEKFHHLHFMKTEPKTLYRHSKQIFANSKNDYETSLEVGLTNILLPTYDLRQIRTNLKFVEICDERNALSNK